MSSTEVLHYSSKIHGAKLLSGLNSLLQDKTFNDVDVCVGKETFSAHRLVLAACSSYFCGMFTGGLSEASKSAVDIHGVEPEIFKSLLDFVYTGCVDINASNAQSLLSAADMLQLDEVVTACCTFLESQLHPSNCLGFTRFAKAYNCHQLVALSMSFTHTHFNQVAKEEEFLELNQDELLEITQSEMLKVETEFDVFVATLDWILHDPSNRRKLLVKVLESIRFPIINSKQLFSYVHNCKDLSLRVALGKLLADYNPERQARNTAAFKPQPKSVSQSLHYKPRRCAIKNLVVVGGYSRLRGQRWNDTVYLESVDKCDSFNQTWTRLSSISIPRNGHGVAAVNGTLYTIGGECESLMYDSVEMLDPVENKWIDAPSLLRPRSGHGTCVVDGVIYVLGGWLGIEMARSIECFDPALGEWCESGGMSACRSNFGIVEVDGLIYIAGGQSDQGPELKSAECFNPFTKEWNSLPNMRTRRVHCGMGVIGDCIYVVGGYSERLDVLQSVERYSITENKWKRVESMPTPRARTAVTTLHGHLYVMGGTLQVGITRLHPL
ncbi:actin-binding protein IPP-like [Amphiura filiformis]|uniref:actin-binding protein IPP-like n=1 Tax=Amphiura filiformis TaxID=82378 RepID=UPI003B21D38D